MAKKLEFNVNTTTVVLVANAHNPSLLNPDFLKLNEVVPADWDVDETITTPGISYVKYVNGVTVQVEPGRCLVSQAGVGQFRDSYEIHDVAKKYVRVLPHIPYHGVGVNWEFSVEKKNAFRWLRDRFLKPGDWRNFGGRMRSAEYKFSIELEGAVLNLGIKPAKFKMPDNGEVFEVAVVDANFHTVVKPTEIESICVAIDRYPEFQAHLLDVAQKFISGRFA
ncbi:MAG: hypothetical protein HOF30_05765 [Rhodospirillaceae bacterium]|nr:hypothetical protein [Rhodospirillaceae bacterium]